MGALELAQILYLLLTHYKKRTVQYKYCYWDTILILVPEVNAVIVRVRVNGTCRRVRLLPVVPVPRGFRNFDSYLRIFYTISLPAEPIFRNLQDVAITGYEAQS